MMRRGDLDEGRRGRENADVRLSGSTQPRVRQSVRLVVVQSTPENGETATTQLTPQLKIDRSEDVKQFEIAEIEQST